MKTTIQTGLAAILLLLTCSCSKDNGDNSGTGTSRSNAISASQSSDAFAETMDNGQTDKSVVGKWILYYDWYCDGFSSSAVITVNADGTWSDSQGYTGLWIQGRRMFVFTFDNSGTTYSGVRFVQQIKGIQSTFDYAQSLQGCFHMVPYINGIIEEHKAGTMDASGKQR